MSATVVVLTDETMADGFRLAGTETQTVEDGPAAEAKLLELLDRQDIGIIAINEDWMEASSEKTRNRIDRLYKPIVVSIPTPTAGEAEDERGSRLARLIRKAVGFEIKVGGQSASEN